MTAVDTGWIWAGAVVVTVKVGDDRRLTIRPAPTAITPRLAFVQLYRTPADSSE